jgi:hypothetical protein
VDQHTITKSQHTLLKIIKIMERLPTHSAVAFVAITTLGKIADGQSCSRVALHTSENGALEVNSTANYITPSPNLSKGISVCCTRILWNGCSGI